MTNDKCLHVDPVEVRRIDNRYQAVSEILRARFKHEEELQAGKRAMTCASIEARDTDKMQIMTEAALYVVKAVREDMPHEHLRKDIVELAAHLLGWLESLR